jgi:anti-anti-sigma factor
MLQIREQKHHQIKVLTLTDKFNRDTKTGIQMLILGAQEMGFPHIILDFSGVNEIDSTSLSELFLWYHNMKPQRVQVSVVKPRQYFRYHLDWADLSEIVSIYASKDEAVEHAESMA